MSRPTVTSSLNRNSASRLRTGSFGTWMMRRLRLSPTSIERVTTMKSMTSFVAQLPKANDHQKAWLETIPPGQWGEKEVSWLHRLEPATSRGLNWQEFNHRLMTGTLVPFRVCGAAEGIWITELVHHDAGSELVIWGSAGERIALHFSDLFEHHSMIARHLGCRWVTAWTESDKVANVLRRAGMKNFTQGLTLEVGRVH